MRLGAALIAVSALLSGGCEAQDVVVATIDVDSGVADGAALGPGQCRTNDQCSATELCAKTDCLQSVGSCHKRPLLCDSIGPPTCGCDGVTYWNDCLRERSGASASSPGECSVNVAKCNDPAASACPVGGASCSRLVPPGRCSPDVEGACWVLPSSCPAGVPSDHWTSCGDPRTCDETCAAIRSGLPHQLAQGPGPMCH